MPCRWARCRPRQRWSANCSACIRDSTIVLTHGDADGRAARAGAVRATGVRHCYLPYDLPGAVRRFLDRIGRSGDHPRDRDLAHAVPRRSARRRIPLVLASARMSDASVGRYRRMAVAGARDAVRRHLDRCADAGRRRAIPRVGAPRTACRSRATSSSTSRSRPASIDAGRALRSRCGAGRPVWIAGSTHEGEESAALDAHARIRARHPVCAADAGAAPSAAIRGGARRCSPARSCDSHSAAPVRCRRRSDEVFLVDTLGELQMFYAAADVAFVGGSLVPIGGHSLLEPAVLGLPMICGSADAERAGNRRAAGRSRGARDRARRRRTGAARGRVFRRSRARARRRGSARAAVVANRGAVGRAGRDGRAAAQGVVAGSGCNPGWTRRIRPRQRSGAGVVRKPLIELRSPGASTPVADFSCTMLIR